MAQISDRKHQQAIESPAGPDDERGSLKLIQPYVSKEGPDLDIPHMPPSGLIWPMNASMIKPIMRPTLITINSYRF